MHVLCVYARSDLVGDLCDNCPSTANAEQYDADEDGTGDACDGVPGTASDDDAAQDLWVSDFDGDGIATIHDNCPFLANADQSTASYGGPEGDACLVLEGDASLGVDDDGDGIINAQDGVSAS